MSRAFNVCLCPSFFRVMSLILSKDYGPGSNAEMAWRKLLILRIVRLFAITKALRRWPIFRELWSVSPPSHTHTHTHTQADTFGH